MKALTVRNIPPVVARRIERRAQESGMSLNRVVVQILEESAGIVHGKKPRLHHDLDALAGSWTKENARAFDESLRDNRKIDPELWK
jgi:hypothetical protein